MAKMAASSLHRLFVATTPVDDRSTARARVRAFMHRTSWQWAVISLIVLDACLVTADIALAFVYCEKGEEETPHAVEDAEVIMRWLSITFLTFFLVEWLVEAWAVHWVTFLTHGLHVLDFTVIVFSLVSELVSVFADEALADLGNLVVVFRLWRIVRVLHAASEITHKEKAAKAAVTLARVNADVTALLRLRDADAAVVDALARECTEGARERTHAGGATPDSVVVSVGGHQQLPELSVLLRRRLLESADLQSAVAYHECMRSWKPHVEPAEDEE